MDAKTINTQVRLTRRSPAYWRVTMDNPPLNIMGPETVRQFQAVIDELEVDGDVRVVVFVLSGRGQRHSKCQHAYDQKITCDGLLHGGTVL